MSSPVRDILTTDMSEFQNELDRKDLIIKNVDNNKVYYSVNKHEHKHYIYCVKCHKKTNIEICPIEEIENKGYKLLSHQIKINGICNECQKK